MTLTEAYIIGMNRGIIVEDHLNKGLTPRLIELMRIVNRRYATHQSRVREICIGSDVEFPSELYEKYPGMKVFQVPDLDKNGKFTIKFQESAHIESEPRLVIGVGPGIPIIGIYYES